MVDYFLPIFEEKGKNYFRKTLIRAQKANSGLFVVTKTSDRIETKNTAEKEIGW